MKRFLLALISFVMLFGWAVPAYAKDNPPEPEPESPKEITEIFNKKLLTQTVMLEYGDEEAFESLKKDWEWAFARVGGRTADKKYEADFEVENFNYGKIDVKKPGTYTVTVVLKLADSCAKEFTVSDEVRTLHITVIVSEQDKITFAYNRCFENFVQYDFSAPEGVKPVLWFAKVARGKEPGSEDWEEAAVDVFYLWMPGAVRILASALIPGSDYYLQMRGDGLVSDVLKLDTSLLIDGEGGINGDRDGDDNNDHTTAPPLMQPAPSTGDDKDGIAGNTGSSGSSGSAAQKPGDKDDDKTDKENNSSQTKPSDETGKDDYEQVTDDTMTISGDRLKWLLDSHTDKVPFGWNDVSVEIPVKVLKKVKLSSKDRLSLKMARKDNKSASIALSANGEKIEDIEGTVMRMPAPEGSYTLSRNGELLDTPVSYEQGLAKFSIDLTGSYELIEKETVLAASGRADADLPGRLSKGQASVLPGQSFKYFLPAVAGGVGVLSLGGWYLWRRRRW